MHGTIWAIGQKIKIRTVTPIDLKPKKGTVRRYSESIGKKIILLARKLRKLWAGQTDTLELTSHI